MNKIITGRLETSPHCPHCKYVIDGFTSLEGKDAPGEGDISICAYCQTVLEFDGNGGLKFATADALAEVNFPVLQKAHRAVAALKLWQR